MADADKILKLLVEMGVTGQSDVQAANDLLDKTANATTTTAKATENLGAAEKEAAGHAEHLHLNHRGLHQIMELIGRQTAPELGHALTGALFGPIGIAVAVGYAFEGIREHIAKTNEELDKMGEKAAQAYANVKANLFDAIREEEFSTEKVDKFFKRIEDDATSAQKAIESALKIAHELESATVKKLKADEENELARIKIDPSLTDAQREAAAAATKTKYAGLIAQQEEKGQTDEVNSAKEELAQKQKQLDAALLQQHQQQMALSPDQVAAVRKAGFTGDLGDVQKIITQWSSANAAQNADQAKKDLGRGENGELEPGGDAARAKGLHDKNDGDISDLTGDGWKSRWAFASHLSMKTGSIVTNDDLDSPQFRKKLADQMRGEIEKADAKVAADERYIEQQKTAEAILRQQTEAQQKLTDEIERLRTEVGAAHEKLKTTATIADIRNNATDYVTGKNASTGILGMLGNLIPKNEGSSGVAGILRAYATATGKADAQTTAIIQGVLNHTLNLQTTLAQLQRQLDEQARAHSNGRNRQNG